jgi:1,4-dihydroxy-6-naphthoate synthase
MPNRPTLTLAHSADADDVFMWWPITGKVNPADPARRIAPPAIDTGRFDYRALPEDIQALNTRALTVGDLDVTAVSMAAYPHLHERYGLTAWGSSFGEGYGPKLVARVDRPEVTLAWLAGAQRAIAVPGLNTSAYLVLSIMLGTGAFRAVPMRFDEIEHAVASGRVDAGVLIHESQLTFAKAGLHLLQDLGLWWTGQMKLPMPLGANAVRRDIDARFGKGALADVVQTLKRSIDHAIAHRRESLDYARTFSPLKTDAELEKYINMYVSPLTVDAGEIGQRAVSTLLARAAALGLCPAIGDVVMLRSENASGHLA